MGWQANLESYRFQRIWAIVILFGVLFSATGLKLIFFIQFAQITNGVLLPLIAAILLWIMNKDSILGSSKNNLGQNILGILLVLISIFLSFRSLWSVYKSL